MKKDRNEAPLCKKTQLFLPKNEKGLEIGLGIFLNCKNVSESSKIKGTVRQKCLWRPGVTLKGVLNQEKNDFNEFQRIYIMI